VVTEIIVPIYLVAFCQNWYCLSKTLAEREAIAYAEKTGLDVVTLCPSLVLGPLLQPTVNTSSLFLIKYLKCMPVSFFCPFTFRGTNADNTIATVQF
jgi:nucleoside-diphosphate-sugar epimerase